MDKMNQIKKEIFISMKMMDTTIKESEDCCEDWRLVICRMNGIKQTIYSGVNH